jgi:hypothetical protein
MSRRGILVLAVATALISCKADLEHHAPSDGDAGKGGAVAATGGSGFGAGGAAGAGGLAQGTGGTALGTGGTATGAGGAAAGAAGGSPGTAGGGGKSGGTGGTAVASGGISGSGGLAGGPGGTGGAPAGCTTADTQCAGTSMQTCGADGTWGPATSCDSAICLGTKCLPKSAILIVSIPQVFAYDAQTGAFASSFRFAEKSVYGATLGPDGKLWIIDTLAKTIVRYDLSGTSLGTFTTTQEYGDYLAFGPDGNLYVSARTSPRGSIVRINATTGALMGTFVQSPLDLQVDGMAFHDGSLFVTYAGSGDAIGGSVYQYSGTTGTFIQVVYNNFAPYGPRTPVFAPDGTMYVPVWQSPDVGKFDAKTLTFISNISLTGLNATSIAVAPDGKLLILSDPLGGSDSVMRYDPKAGTFTTLVPTGSGGLNRAHTIIYR